MRPFVIIFLLLTVGLQVPAALASTNAERAEELFLEGSYDKAMTEADKAIDADSGKKYELYYLKGLSALKLNKFADARKAFEYVKDRYPRSDRAMDSYIGIGDAYFLEGNTQGALRSYKAASDAFPDNKNIVIVRQRITDCMAKSGTQERAKEYTALKPAERLKESVNFTPKDKMHIHIEPSERAAAGQDGAGQFSVQVGSFKSKSNASKLTSKLSAKRYEARLESPVVGSSDKLYRVKVGRISSKEEAERLAMKLKREGYPTRVCQED